MSVRKIPGRNQRIDVFKILPYMIAKKPHLDPKHIFTEEIIKKIPKALLHETFEFMGINQNIREVLYSYNNFKFKCWWCNKEFVEMGCEVKKSYNLHKKDCDNPFFIILNGPKLYTIKKNVFTDKETNEKFNYIRIKNNIIPTIIKVYCKDYHNETAIIEFENLYCSLLELSTKDIHSNMKTLLDLYEKYIYYENE
jgi:hypothetical protein